jgi:hypothetical protein
LDVSVSGVALRGFAVTLGPGLLVVRTGMSPAPVFI